MVKVRTELHHKAERIPRTAREEREGEVGEREEPVRPPAERSPSAREKCKASDMSGLKFSSNLGTS